MTETGPQTDDVKKMFLSGGKRKYEFLKFVLSSRELQSEKPFVLAALAITRLDIKKSDLNNKAFGQWLRRYRGKNKAKQSTSTTSASIPHVKAGEKTDVGQKFQFTDPSTLPREEGSLIKFVK